MKDCGCCGLHSEGVGKADPLPTCYSESPDLDTGPIKNPLTPAPSSTISHHLPEVPLGPTSAVLTYTLPQSSKRQTSRGLEHSKGSQPVIFFILRPLPDIFLDLNSQPLFLPQLICSYCISIVCLLLHFTPILY
jgi:hypothetical protein